MTPDYRFSRFELKPASRELLADGKPAALGARAFDVLLALIERRERMVTKDELLELAWPGLVVEENNLQVQISSLRKILGDELIKTVPGHGYRFMAEPSTVASPGPRRSELPHALTRFIGHDAELDAYEEIVVTGRLVTLTGSGGCGKTRLAIELASRLLPRFADGAWFVDLASLTDTERVPSTVARTLGLAERPGQPILETLCQHLAGQQLLLVLDNCEHVIPACAVLTAALLRRCRQLHILTTSREAIGLLGEQTLGVRSLSCPPPEWHGDPDGAEFEAVQLFLDRARLVQPHLTLDSAAASAVGEICRRLDGIPLAIELAAARTKVLSVHELRAMLDDRFRLLVGGSRTAPPRQQTLLATIKWSFDLLPPDERRLLERLSVFHGGWTFDAAVAVAGSGADHYELVNLLSSLVDKSLVSVENSGERYRLLQTLRQYAQERLRAAADEAAVRERHFNWYLRLAERVEPSLLGGPQQKDALDLLEVDHDNLSIALVWSLETSERVDLALRLCGTLYRFWSRRGYWQEGYAWCMKALAQAPRSADKAARAKALLAAGSLANNVPGVETRLLLEDALVLSREAGDRATEAVILNNLARVLDWHLELSRTRSLLERARRINRELGNRVSELHNMSNLVNVLRAQDDLPGALALADDGLVTSRAFGDRWLEAIFLYLLGRVALDRGEVAVARTFNEQALAIFRELAMPDWESFSLVKLGFLAVVRSDAASARPHLAEAVDISQRFGGRLNLAECFDAMGVLASHLGRHEQAARLWGAAEGLLGSLFSSDILDRELIRPYYARSRNALGDIAYDAARAAGRALSREAAIDQAKAWLATAD